MVQQAHSGPKFQRHRRCSASSCPRSCVTRFPDLPKPSRYCAASPRYRDGGGRWSRRSSSIRFRLAQRGRRCATGGHSIQCADAVAVTHSGVCSPIQCDCLTSWWLQLSPAGKGSLAHNRIPHQYQVSILSLCVFFSDYYYAWLPCSSFLRNVHS